MRPVISCGGTRRIDPGRQGAEDLGVVAGLGLLEDPLQRPPRTVSQRYPGDDVQQARPGERPVVFPQGRDDFMEPEPVGQRHLGRRRFERLDLLDPVVLLLLGRLASRRPGCGARPGTWRTSAHPRAGASRASRRAGRQARRPAWSARGRSTPRRVGRRPGVVGSTRQCASMTRKLQVRLFGPTNHSCQAGKPDLHVER